MLTDKEIQAFRGNDKLQKKGDGQGLFLFIYPLRKDGGKRKLKHTTEAPPGGVAWPVS